MDSTGSANPTDDDTPQGQTPAEREARAQRTSKPAEPQAEAQDGASSPTDGAAAGQGAHQAGIPDATANMEATANSLPGDAAAYRMPWHSPTVQDTTRQWASRRRRHYIFYARRTARTRQAARASTLGRAAWVAVVVLGAVAVTALTATLGLAASYYQSESATIAGLSGTVSARDSMRIYDTNGVLLYEFQDTGAQHSIAIADVPVALVNATVAIEDKTFWVNQGVDFTSIVRAALADVSHGHITQGASTITQQLIKQNILNSNQTFSRKIREAILSIGMTETQTYSKAQILELYLNSIPYGQNAYGIDAAAHAYFGYSDNQATGETAAQQLDLAQASMLAGIPQNPNTNDPLLHPAAAHARQLEVLNAMVAAGFITRAQAAAAAAESLRPNFFNPPTATQDLAPAFVELVKQQLDNMIAMGQVHLSRSGLDVYTTLDINMQNHVQQYMRDHLYGNDISDYQGGGYIRNDNVTNSAAVMVDQHTGAIKVLLGSVNYNDTSIDGQFDVATQGYRSPGSSFKPIVYATAFQKGWFPAMTVADSPTVFWDSGKGTTYQPLDFNPTLFHGAVTLRTALQYSLNIPAVKVMQYAGISAVLQNAARFGIHSYLGTPGLSTVLGALDVTLYDMTQVYAVLADYGQYIPLHAIDRITDSSGDVLYQYHVPQPVQVLSPQIAFLLTNMLSDNPARIGEWGTCSPLYLDTTADCYAHNGNSPNAWPAAAKTGTAQNFTDDFTMGYTMQYTLGVWAGNSNNTSMRFIDGVTGAAPIWYHSMMYAEQNLPKVPFPVPSGVQRATYTSDGITSTDWFLAGPLPPANIGNQAPASTPCIYYNSDYTAFYFPWQRSPSAVIAAPWCTPSTG